MNQIVQVREQLEGMSDQFAAALPQGITSERFNRVVMTVLQDNAALLQADRKSLFRSCMQCAQDGFLPDGKEAALVLYGNQVRYLPMFQGIMKKLLMSELITEIYANLVYSNDQFEYVSGDNEQINHKPVVFGDRGKFLGAYAIAKTRNGGTFRELMSAADIDQVKQASRSKGKGPWTSWFEQMAKKTVIRRLVKRLPVSSEVASVIKQTDDFYDMKQSERTGPPPIGKKTQEEEDREPIVINPHDLDTL